MKNVVLSVLLVTSLMTASVSHAGFLEDFYDAAGSQTSITRAGVYESQNLSLATGGSFVLKVPRKSFSPITIDAPYLKAGCGGIDIFLGAFSLPSKDEFLSFLRSVGTAIPGLAFQLALQHLSPDLNEQVTQFRDLIMEATEMFSDSCKAAEWIVNEGAGAVEWLAQSQLKASNNLRSTGEASDASEADSLTRTDGGKVMSSVPDRTDAEGNIVESSELNLTWSLLKGGKFAESVSQETLETMMTLLGTTLYRKTGSGDSTTVQSEDIGARDLLWDLYGSVDEVNPSSSRLLTCDEAKKCLNPSESVSKPVNLVRSIYLAAANYRKSIVSRNPAEVTDKEVVMLAAISSIPLLAIVEASASSKIPTAGDAMMRLYSEAAAYEAITTALSDLAIEVRRLITSSSARSVNSINVAHAEKLEARLTVVLSELRQREDKLYSAMARAQSYAVQAAHIERSVYGRAALEASSVLPRWTRR
ncbi:MAG: conjugal transfer protein TraH [Sutterella sp.]|nr:conjugal transfer protein TraH [Sutterella sp.]